MYQIAASVLSADFSRLAEEIKTVDRGGADCIHIDVMDGAFVPNITFGPKIVDTIKKLTGLPLDVHLMIQQPERFIADFADAGADIITVHAEACTHLHRTLQQIHEHGAQAGVAFNPATPLSTLDYIAEDINQILVMTVNPGFGGQKFIDGMLQKIEQARALIKQRNLPVGIEVDGGINPHTIASCTAAGANIFVAGSFIYNNTNHAEAIGKLRSSLPQGAQK
ncbi:MAG: ribulose-phosphate 3-epimerase [Sporolactobacillus sp.]|jgi:ribulose-phosphate 3-epimerase|nr:ribulose-phosphate 3-epimerase [Sporolactobacillus sp.]